MRPFGFLSLEFVNKDIINESLIQEFQLEEKILEKDTLVLVTMENGDYVKIHLDSGIRFYFRHKYHVDIKTFGMRGRLSKGDCIYSEIKTNNRGIEEYG